MAPAILVGTRKGLFVLKGDETRRKWEFEGPHLSGWDVFHAMKHDGSLYAAANHGVYGATVQRSDDGGKTWERSEALGLPEDTELTLEKTWHVEPGTNGNTLWLGGAPGVLFRSDDRGESWEPVMSLIQHPTRERWNPGAGGMCTHSIQVRPDRPEYDLHRDLRCRRLPQRRRWRNVGAEEQRHGRRLQRGRPLPRARPVRPQGTPASGAGGPSLAAEPLRRLSHGRQGRELGASRGQRTSELASAFRSRSTT